MSIFSLLIACILIGQLLEQKPAPPAGYNKQLFAKAVKITHSSIIVDGHIDVPYRLEEKMEDISQATANGHFDYPRVKQGGLDAPFMSIYIPARLQKTAGASKAVAEKLITMMDSIITGNPDKFAKAVNPTEVRRNFAKGLISLPYGMENGSAIENDLANIDYFYRKGIRYITLTHSKKNLICDSSYDPDKGWNGLSPFGKKVVVEMNRLGIMVDISHVTDSTFYQVLRLSKTPVICSHSSLRNFTPGFERNVNDDMLRKLAAKNGVIMINFGSAFLTSAANKYGSKYQSYFQTFKQEQGITSDNDPRLKKEITRYKKANPYPKPGITDVIDHIEHAVRIAGIDHVGLGSDFDGVSNLPTEVESVADYPNIVYHLLKRNYSEEDISKILSGNVMRVWQEVTEFASKQMQNETVTTKQN